MSDEIGSTKGWPSQPIHETCVGCNSVACEADGIGATLALLAQFRKSTHDEIVQMMCFVHRRRYAEMVKHLEAHGL
jgi:hypothetical protein